MYGIMRGLRGFLILVVLAVLLGGCASNNTAPAPPLTPELLEARFGLGTIRAMAVSADGRTLAVAGDAGRAYLWDLHEHRFHRVLTPGTDPKATSAPALTGVALLETGDVLASSRSGSVYRWSAQGEIQGTLRGPGSPILCVAAARDGSVIVAGTEDGHLLAWDKTGTLQANVPAHQGPVRAVMLTADHKATVSGGDDKNATSCTLPALTVGKSFRASSAVLSLGMTDDGTQVLCGCEDGMIKGLDLAAMREARSWSGIVGPVTALAVTRSVLVAGSTSQALRSWDISQPNETKSTKLPEDQGAIHAVALLPGTTTVAAGGDQRLVALHDVNTAQEKEPVTIGHPTTTLGVASSPDGLTVATAGGGPDLLLWDVATRSLARILPGDQGNLQAVAWAGNGWLATGSEKGAVRVYDKGYNVVTTLRLEAQVNSVAFDGAGTRLAVGGWDRQIHVWTISDTAGQGDLKLAGILQGHTNGVSAISFSGDGRTLVSSSWDHTVRLWDMDTLKEKTPLSGMAAMDGPVFSAAFSPADPTVAASGWHGQTWTWNSDTGAVGKRENLHKDVCYTLLFSKDGSLLASGAAGTTKAAGEPGGSLTLWNASSMTSNRHVEGFRAAIRGLAWLAQNRVAVGTLDGFLFTIPITAESASPAPTASPSASPAAGAANPSASPGAPTPGSVAPATAPVSSPSAAPSAHPPPAPPSAAPTR